MVLFEKTNNIKGDNKLMKYKVAFFVDWDNLRKDIVRAKKDAKKKKENYKTIDYNDVNHIFHFFENFLDPTEEIYRIFFYTAKPLRYKDIKHIKNEEIKTNFKEHPRADKIDDFLNAIAKKDFFALRLGKLKYKGVDPRGKHIIQQKKVDMLIGLDIAHISYLKLVDKIIVFSKDTDIAPALKCARVCGIQVKMANLEFGIPLSDELRKHSDFIVDREILKIGVPKGS